MKRMGSEDWLFLFLVGDQSERNRSGSDGPNTRCDGQEQSYRCKWLARRQEVDHFRRKQSKQPYKLTADILCLEGRSERESSLGDNQQIPEHE